MTTRRWMVAVAMVAVLMAGSIEYQSWKQRNEYARALRRCIYGALFYENGTITVHQYVEWSRVLMEAQLSLSTTRNEQISVMQAHLNRASRICNQEAKKYGMCNYWPEREAAIARESLVECQTRLDHLTKSPASPGGGIIGL